MSAMFAYKAFEGEVRGSYCAVQHASLASSAKKDGRGALRAGLRTSLLQEPLRADQSAVLHVSGCLM